MSGTAQFEGIIRLPHSLFSACNFLTLIPQCPAFTKYQKLLSVSKVIASQLIFLVITWILLSVQPKCHQHRCISSVNSTLDLDPDLSLISYDPYDVCLCNTINGVLLPRCNENNRKEKALFPGQNFTVTVAVAGQRAGIYCARSCTSQVCSRHQGKSPAWSPTGLTNCQHYKLRKLNICSVFKPKLWKSDIDSSPVWSQQYPSILSSTITFSSMTATLSHWGWTQERRPSVLWLSSNASKPRIHLPH